MQALARFAMTGRYRALLIAIASSGSLLFAWFGAAIVALVTLRKGAAEGGWVLLWASLPALVLTRISGDSSALAMLVGTGLLAFVLRGTVNIALAAVATTAVGILTALGLLVFGDALLAQLADVFAQFFAALESEAQAGGAARLGLQPPTQFQLAGMMGTANAVLCFLCLALARYWQAALYNPGGFGEEFRGLKLPPMLVVAFTLGAVAIASLGLEYRSWAAALLVPLTVAGFALLHARARHRGQGSFWLSGVYLAWLVFDAAKLALVGLVLADAVLDLRARWTPRDGEKPGERPGEDSGNEDSSQGDDKTPEDRDSDRK